MNIPESLRTILLSIAHNGKIKLNKSKKEIKVVPKFSKLDFFEVLTHIDEEIEREYIQYFGVSDISLKLYPTVKKIKDDYNVSYKELSKIKYNDLVIAHLEVDKRIGHKNTEITSVINKNYKKYYTKEEFAKILENHGIESDNSIDINDYFEFYKLFGNNPELYKKLKPLKEDAEVSWEEIKSIKYEDIDFKNKNIYFKKENDLDEIEIED